MDISTTATPNSQSIKTPQNSSVKTNTKTNVSFEDEIKKSSNSEEKEITETEENIKETKSSKTEQEEDKKEIKENKNQQTNTLKPQEMVMLQNQENIEAHNNILVLLNANEELTNITQDLNISVKIDYTTIEMDENDAKFFYELTQNTDKAFQNIVTSMEMNIDNQTQDVQKTVQISKTLMETIAEATKTNQPFRINFDKDISVIIKIDKDGLVSAKFIPGDKAVEEYLKQNISTLRQNFDNQELPYKELSYSKQQEKQQQQRRKNNKENPNE